MSSLDLKDKHKLEELFGMSSGYVLNFSDRTFGEFFLKHSENDIHDEKYQREGTSKAKKLREYWNIESDTLVGNMLLALIEYSQTIPEYINDPLALECRQIANRLLSGQPNLKPIKDIAREYNAPYLSQQLRRMEAAIDTDPDLAIGTAKEHVETCCKMILEARGKPVEGAPDIPTLTKTVLKELKLVPEGIPEEARGKDVIKRLLSNLGTIGNNLAELRGLYGTGHGKHGRSSGLKPRHAKLAVSAAVTLATFLFDTHKEME